MTNCLALFKALFPPSRLRSLPFFASKMITMHLYIISLPRNSDVLFLGGAGVARGFRGDLPVESRRTDHGSGSFPLRGAVVTR